MSLSHTHRHCHPSLRRVGGLRPCWTTGSSLQGAVPNKGEKSLVQVHKQAGGQARQQPSSHSFPTSHLFGTYCSFSTFSHMGHGVGGPVTSHILGVLPLVIQPKRPFALLTKSQGHLAASAATYTYMGLCFILPGQCLDLQISLNPTHQSQPLNSFLDPDCLSPPVHTPS